jgi:hypothetical protein
MRPTTLIRGPLLAALLGGASITPAVAKEPPIDVGLAPERLLFLRTEAGSDAGGIMGISSATGSVTVDLPMGVADASWSVLFAASFDGADTIVTAYDPRSGATLRQTRVPGTWALPVVVDGGAPEGLSADGQTLVLVDQATGADASRFAVLDTSLTSEPEIVAFHGDFTFDALSPDGRSLYLIEHLDDSDTGRYVVRVYDAVTGLATDPIVDKRNLDERMEGRPVSRVASPDGVWVHTLYVTADGGAFIHQLNTVERHALCAGLPGNATTLADARAWRMALRGGTATFAVNGRLGIVSSVANGDLRSTRPLPAPNLDANLTISPDGRTLYVSRGEELLTLPSSRLLADHTAFTPPLAGLSVAPDGEWLYGLEQEGRSIVIVQVVGGKAVGSGWVEVSPWTTRPVDLLGSADAGVSLARARD